MPKEFYYPSVFDPFRNLDPTKVDEALRRLYDLFYKHLDDVNSGTVNAATVSCPPTVGGAATLFTDDFQRDVNQDLFELATPWVWCPLTVIPLPGGNWDLGSAFISSNQLVLAAYGADNPTTKKSNVLVPSTLINSTMWGQNQFSRGVIVGETGTGSFSGPCVMCTMKSGQDAGNNHLYVLAVRNSQWRLDRRDGDTGTNLIAFTSFTIPATLELQCQATGPTQNTLSVYVNSSLIATAVDNSGNIKGTGIPGMYVQTQNNSPGADDTTTWSSYAGGII